MTARSSAPAHPDRSRSTETADLRYRLRSRALGLAAVVLAWALSAGVALAPAATPPRSASACKPGIRPIGGKSARVFCGPARATVRVSGRTLRFRNGQCSKLPASLAVNIGTLIIGDTRSKTQYFGLLLVGHAKDGTYTGALLSFRSGGKAYAVAGTRVTLAGGHTRGTFRGKAIATGAPVTGSFTC